MNRSITNVLFGAFGSAATATVAEGEQGEMREVGLDDIAVQLAYANKVIFVPGYGLATAQAQHAVFGVALPEEAVKILVIIAVSSRPRATKRGRSAYIRPCR